MAPVDQQVLQTGLFFPPYLFPLRSLPACALALPVAPVGVTFPAAVLEAGGPRAPLRLAAAATPVPHFVPAPPSSGKAASCVLDEPSAPFI